MNLKHMNEEEYHKFKLFLNAMVFFALVMVFLFVELNRIESKLSFVPMIILALIFLMLGVSTIFPEYYKKEGQTFMVFALLLFFYNIGLVIYGNPVNLAMLIEYVTAIMLLLYGVALIHTKRSFFDISSLEFGKEKLE